MSRVGRPNLPSHSPVLLPRPCLPMSNLHGAVPERCISHTPGRPVATVTLCSPSVTRSAAKRDVALRLRAHPTVKVISRDRAGAYAEGARQGAPDAVQIADRFHLFCNLTQALQRVLARLASTLHRLQFPQPPGLPTAPAAASNVARIPDVPVAEVKEAELQSSAKLNPNEQQRQRRREERKARFEAVRAAYQRGLTKRAIAREPGLTRTTVRRFLRAKEFPERAPRRRQSELDSFRDHLERRWAEGCRNTPPKVRKSRARYPSASQMSSAGSV